MKINSIKKRADFLLISAGGSKFAVSTFILLTLPGPKPDSVRFGLTATKKLGGAVVRNRIRRRLREAFRAAAPGHAKPGHDYVLIARKNALLCEYATLIRDLQFALPRVHKMPQK
jgi:ribonuclease P protein component